MNGFTVGEATACQTLTVGGEGQRRYLFSALKTGDTCLLVCLIAIEPLSLSFLDQHFILDYLKPLIHVVWSLSSLQSIHFYRINSYLLNPNSSPTCPKSRGKIPFKGGSLSHPEISVSECEPFSQKKINISKGFCLFQFKIVLLKFKISL
jgi:hypothetical protein